GGAVVPWLMNTMGGILRGTGNMKLPSFLMLSSAVCQIILGGTLGLGLGPIPSFGMRGVAAGSLTAYLISISVMGWYMFSASVRAASRQYLSTAAPMYAFIGLATAMYFSSQGAAKVLGPVLAQTARLVFIAAGGWWLSTHAATAQNFFALAAASMGLLGVLS